MDIEEVPPPLLEIREYHNQRSKKMDIKEVQSFAPPPPPPSPLPPSEFIKRSKKMDIKEVQPRLTLSAPLPPSFPPPPLPCGYRPHHNQRSKNMNIKEVQPPPPPPLPIRPFLFRRLYHQQRSQKINIKEVQPSALPPPPVLPSGSRRYYYQRNKKIDIKEVNSPLPTSIFGRNPYQTRKKIDIKEIHRPRPPPPSSKFTSYHNQISRKKDDIKEVHPPPPRPQTISAPLPPPFPPPPLLFGPGPYHHQSGKELEKQIERPCSFQSKIYDDQNPTENIICPLSHPTQPHALFATFGRNSRDGCFTCGEKTSPWTDHRLHHFLCKTCVVEFHSGCHMFPRNLIHPYHLQHPLTLTFRNCQTGIVISNASIDESFCILAFSDSDHEKSGSMISNVIFYKCTWCGKSIQINWYYRCSICNFCLDLSCAQDIPRLVVTTPKSHHHSLAFYPRPLLTPCDACGWVNVSEPSYACFQCNYMVHQSCIELPRVIKITRHQHRLFHTPYLQPTISPCQICYQPIDIKYSNYSCNHGDCSYVSHSKCATHENVWEGKELEWEPEEIDKIEDIIPFKKVGTDLIKHFSHDEHLLKLEKYDGVRDAEKQCQACILPIDFHDFYNCIDCDFFLHEVCAGLLRKLDHALHIHPLFLDPSPQRQYEEINGCLVCSRKSAGFWYRCSRENCVLFNKAQIDVRCILVPELFTHKAHAHPVYISTSYKGKVCCEGCKEICPVSYLQCSECKFAICYRCATIPSEVFYKYDKHPLSLCCGEKAKHGMYWCEVCEKEVNTTDWFYACNNCCTTVHLQCVFGPSAYMKPGFVLKHDCVFTKMKVFRNCKSTRPFCTECGQRCPSSVYYKVSKTFRSGALLCSLNCLTRNAEWLMLSRR